MHIKENCITFAKQLRNKVLTNKTIRIMENVYPFNDNAFKNDVTTTKAYRIRVKLNNKEKLSREEKNFITNECNHNCFLLIQKQCFAFLGFFQYHLYYFYTIKLFHIQIFC